MRSYAIQIPLGECTYSVAAILCSQVLCSSLLLNLYIFLQVLAHYKTSSQYVCPWHECHRHCHFLFDSERIYFWFNIDINMPLVTVDTNAVTAKGGTDIIRELKTKVAAHLGVPPQKMLIVVRYGTAMAFGDLPGPVANVRVMSLVGLNGENRHIYAHTGVQKLYQFSIRT